MIETEVENGVCLHLTDSTIVKSHKGKYGAGTNRERH